MVTNDWSRNALAGPARSGKSELFLTIAFRKACWESLGTVSYSNVGVRLIMVIETYMYMKISV